MEEFGAFERKMRQAGMGDAVVRAFQRNYNALLRKETGLIAEAEIVPADGVPTLSDVAGEDEAFDPGLLAAAVVVKLNGGLGTSMGLQRAKSLLPVREDITFLDLIVKQILHLRRVSGSKVRLLLMDSFNTSGDTLAHMRRYAADGLSDASEIELMQNQVPKIDARTLTPAEWPTNPELEWCPPGHGDLFPALVGSGWLDRLLAEGVRYAFVSNSDNLGAVVDAGLLRYFAACGAPFLMEVTRRTEADRKGGHLAVRKSDGRLLLREVAQCPDADMNDFQDIAKHRYFNTNSLWLRLDLLKERLVAERGALPLPMIQNRKTVDPRDVLSTPVIQLEVAMGAAIECFDGARAVEVPRSRFAPVKTTGDLLALRSDAYEIDGGGRVGLRPERNGIPPVVTLGGAFKLVDSLDRLGMPGLLGCRSLVVDGLVSLDSGVVIEGDVTIRNEKPECLRVPAGTYRDEKIG